MGNPLSLSGVLREEFLVVQALSPLSCPLGEILLADFLLSALFGEGLLEDVLLLLSSVEVSLYLSPLD